MTLAGAESLSKVSSRKTVFWLYFSPNLSWDRKGLKGRDEGRGRGEASGGGVGSLIFLVWVMCVRAIFSDVFFFFFFSRG